MGGEGEVGGRWLAVGGRHRAAATKHSISNTLLRNTISATKDRQHNANLKSQEHNLLYDIVSPESMLPR